MRLLVRTLARCTAVLALAGAPMAQMPQMFEVGELRSMGIYPAISNPDFTTTVTGHLMGFYAPDVVVLAGSTPVLLALPGVHSSAVWLPLPAVPVSGFDLGDVRDIAILKDGATLQGSSGPVVRDALLMVTGNGLWRWIWSNVTGAAVSDIGNGNTAWNGALKLRLGDVDGNGKDDLMALLADGHTILGRNDNGVEWSLDVGSNVRDFLVMDWVSGGTREIVTVTAANGAFPGGIQVFATGDTDWLERIELPNTSAVCTRASDAAGLVRLMVACRTNSVDKLFYAGPSLLTQVRRLSGQVRAIAAAQMAGDAGDDVYLTLGNEASPWRLIQNGSFGFGDPQMVSLAGGSVTTNKAMPLLADLNGDGSREILYPLKATGKIIVQRCVSYGLDFVDIEPSTETTAIEGVPIGNSPTHIEVFLWPMNLVSAPMIDTSVPAVHYFTVLEPGTPITTTLMFPEFEDGHPWSMAIRFVQMEQGVILHRWVIRSSIFCLPWDKAAVLALFPGEQPIGQQQTSPDVAWAGGGAIPPVIFARPPGYGTAGSTVQPPDLPEPGTGTPPQPPAGGDGE